MRKFWAATFDPQLLLVTSLVDLQVLPHKTWFHLLRFDSFNGLITNHIVAFK